MQYDDMRRGCGERLEALADRNKLSKEKASDIARLHSNRRAFKFRAGLDGLGKLIISRLARDRHRF